MTNLPNDENYMNLRENKKSEIKQVITTSVMLYLDAKETGIKNDTIDIDNFGDPTFDFGAEITKGIKISEEIEQKYNTWLIHSGGLAQGDMTIRDHFAGLAMQGLISHYGNEALGRYDSCIQEVAYKLADAMLKERAK
jgi:hypothetical protein